MSSEQTRKRRENQSRILEHLQRTGGDQRSALSKALNMRKSSVTSISRELLDRGALDELVPGAFRSPLALHPGYWRAGVIDLQPGHATTAVVDAAGAISRRIDHELAADADPPLILKTITEGVQASIDSSETNQVIGIGASLPGITDPNSGIGLSAVNLNGWRDIDIRSALERELGIGVAVRNDANCEFLGNCWFKPWGRDLDEAVYLSVHRGIGCSQISRGEHVLGRHFAAGEIGFLPAGDESDLQSVSSAPAIAEALAAQRPELANASPAELAAAIATGAPALRDTFETSLRPLADKLATIIAFADPDGLVIATEDDAFTVEVERVLTEQMRGSLKGLYSEKISIHRGFVCADGALLGAAAAVFREGFSTETLRLNLHTGEQAESYEQS